MRIILGERIKRAVHEDRRSAKAICDVVGMSRGNLDKIYKKDSINTDLLARISRTLSHDFFQYVNPFVMSQYEGEEIQIVEERTDYGGAPLDKLSKCMITLNATKKEMDFIQRQLSSIESQVEDKRRIIKNLDEKNAQLRKQLEECQKSSDAK